MQKKIFTLIFLTFLSFHSKATFTPVTLTGFNGDAIANGIGNASASTTVDVDGVNYAFVAQDFQATSSSPAPSYYLPTGGALTSLLTPGLGFQLASYSSNNVLRLSGSTSTTNTGTLSFATAQTAGELYVLCTSGSGNSTATITVNFTNSTSQTFTNISVLDWYNGTASVAGIGRVNTTNNITEGTSANPRLYEVKLTLSSTNYSNQIASITVTKTSTSTEILDVLAVSKNDVCTGTPTTTGITPSPATVCSGNAAVLTVNGVPTSAGITYQWQSLSGTTWGNIASATSQSYTTPALTAQAIYRCIVTCSGSSLSVTTNPDTVNVATSFTPPYLETFESIINDNDMPNCMSGTHVGTYIYTRSASIGNNTGNHTPGGTKYAAFRYSCQDTMFTPALNLTAGTTYQIGFWYNTDGLSGWTTLGAAIGTTPNSAAMTTTIGTPLSGPTNMTYQQYTGTFTPTTSGVYFVGIYCKANSIPWYISIDDISVNISTCAGTPTAGTAAASVTGGCAATNFTLSITGGSTGSGISRQWQSASSATGPWTNLASGTTTTYSVSGITATTYYRNYVSCSGSGLGDTSNVVTVNKYPLVYTATTSGTVCAGSNVTLNTSNPTPGATYQWSGPNSFSATTASAIINNATTAANGSYTLTTTVNGCTASQSVTVTVNPKPVITATGTNPTTCGGTNGTLIVSGLTANTAYVIAYTFNSSASTHNITTTATGSYTFTGMSTGTYSNISATSAAGCVSDPVNPVTISNPVSVPDPIAGSNAPICTGATLSLNASSTLSGVVYHWSGPNGFTSTTQNPSISNATVAASGTYTVYTTYQACTSNTVSVNAAVNPKPNANIYVSNSTTICQGSFVTLSVSTVAPGNTYQWQNNGGSIGGANGNTYDANADGNYRVIVNNASGCSDTSTVIPVTVIALPASAITHSGPLTICQGNSTLLEGPTGTGYSYQWYKDGSQISGATNIDYSAKNAGFYTLIVTGTGGCNAVSAGVTVTVSTPVTPIITFDGSALSTSGFASYQWYKDNTPIPGATNATLTITSNGYYTVTGTDAAGCTTMSAMALISTLNVGNLTVNGNDVNIYPNPASTMVHIDAAAKLNVQIRNLEGQTVMTKKAASDIDISGIANGVYMISLTDKDGNLIKIDRLIIVH
ncbi:beta strand repeat-containing protein [Taibaiella soli]|uniref:Ig-like domain-containing protein n=1 Tax=Taibaiella soli TaxID=1649169 RepID=A0A2W2ABI1_9BACT|nr:T9SS type A sorting domain-containing protein [Taibaiella soli]PZF72775.1 hypothetical protein DN068_10175 [Taibaiella soli]